MTYTIGEISKMTGIAVHTLRFYDKKGLFNHIKRTSSGIRMFTDEELLTIKWINCLKSTGMNLNDIKRYLDMNQLGDSTLTNRLELFMEREDAVHKQIDELNRTLAMIQIKKWWYQTSIEHGTEAYVRNLQPKDYPEEIYNYMKIAFDDFDQE